MTLDSRCRKLDTLIVTLILACACLAQCAVASNGYIPKAHPPTNGRVGTNYTPAYAVNQVQFWHDFRADVVDRELAAARKHFGINMLRVFLHNINFEQDKDVFFANLETFLTICHKYEIKVGFVFFDDCHRHEGIFLEEPTDPIKGYHNGRWAACPQDRDRDPANIERFKPYLQEVVRPYRTDSRVLWWEISNEPNMKSPYSVSLRKLGYVWVKELNPTGPVISCWEDNEFTDIVNVHNYTSDFESWDRKADLNPAKGCLFTEAGARWLAPRTSNGEPCEFIHWLNRRKATGKSLPGVCLCWELMVGHSNCRWYWGTPEGTPEPTIPWCGLLWPDGTPVSLAEAEAIRRYALGQSQALFFDDFQDISKENQPDRPGWKTYGGGRRSDSGYLPLDPGIKMVADVPKWTDYVLEGRVMLKSETGNAGLIFRVNDPGPGRDQMRGYYVGLDTHKLTLGKMSNNWQPLATFDLAQLDCKVTPNVWNQIRIAAEGPRIRVWLNRMHPSADPDKGLGIDFTDEKDPILSGAIGVRTHNTAAWFDNIVALPCESPAVSDMITGG